MNKVMKEMISTLLLPGVSRSSRLLSSRIHCFPLVTPGLLPVLVQALPAKELMKVDLPTLGIPTTMARGSQNGDASGFHRLHQ